MKATEVLGSDSESAVSSAVVAELIHWYNHD